MALRLLHSADWQLGREFAQVADPAMRARLYDQRFDAIRRLGELAARHQAQALLVAGDVFESNVVGPSVLQQAADALAQVPVPVLLLPGNHDPAAPEGALDRLRDRVGDHVRILDTPEAVSLGEGLVVHPCPLRPAFHGDPTAHLEPAPRDGRVHVVLAHGSDRALTEAVQDRPLGAQLDLARVGALGHDYVALGDWHSVTSVAPHVWYASTPERYTWKEKDPGHALLVEIDGPGAPPKVTVLDVGRSRWSRLRHTLLDRDDLGALIRQVDTLPELSHTWLRLDLTGTLPLDDQARLSAWLDELTARCGQLDVERLEIAVPAGDHTLGELADDPILQAVAHDLLARAQEEPGAAPATEPEDLDLQADPTPAPRDVARAALNLLLQAWRDAGPGREEAP